MDVIRLQSGESIAEISLMGGECLRWLCAGREMLWRADPAIWDRTAPLLFPVCGWTRNGEVRVAGKAYPLGLHGFAGGQIFELVAQQADHVTLRLHDNESTQALYPFSFCLEVTYRLTPTTLEVSGQVTNQGAAVMPYGFGLHPGFQWLGTPEACRVVFEERELAEVPVIAPGGLFSDERRPVPLEERHLPLGGCAFAQEALCFLNARSQAVTLEGPSGQLRVEAEGFPHWVIWSKPAAPFICLESWCGYGDPVGFAGELAEKPGMVLLAPGDRRRHLARYMFTA